MGIALTPEQENAVRDRGGETLVSAAAGSGKTRVLVERLLARVAEGADIDAFLVITYTRAAAAELRERIVEALQERLADDLADSHLHRQTALVYSAPISTVHGFCASFLRENACRLDIAPDFRVLEEDEAALLRRGALEDVLEARYENMTDEFAALVDNLSAGWSDEKLNDLVLEFHGKLQSQPDPSAWMTEQRRLLRMPADTDPGETPWGAVLLERADQSADWCVRELKRAAAAMEGDEKLTKAYLPSYRETIDNLTRFRSACAAGWDDARAALPIEFPRLGQLREFEDPDLKDRLQATRKRCQDRCKKLDKLLFCTGPEAMEDLAAVAPVMESLFDLTEDFDRAYAAAKRRRRGLDFSDLEHLTLAALLAQPELAAACSERFCEVMVDEYQDTNRVQDAIFRAVSDGGRKLFCVGDVKQSIYRFRLADPTIFLEKYDRFPPREQAAEGAPRRMTLSLNFRSRPAILAACNFVFENILSRELGEVDYSEDQRLNFGPPDDGAVTGSVTLAVLDRSAEPAKEGEKPPRSLQEARYIADAIAKLLAEGKLITDPDGARRPVRPGDIAILMRSQSGVLGYFTRALQERGIPCAQGGGEKLFEALEVSAVLSLLAVVDNPQQDVPLLSVLRSPIFGFSGDRLAELRLTDKNAGFYDLLRAAADRGEADCAAVCKAIDDLREASMDDTVEQLLRRCCALLDIPTVFRALRGGADRGANLDALLDYARRFEETGRRSLFDFLRHVEGLREADKSPALPDRGGSEGVSILTIHRSKGLEYPVVFLAGLARRFNREDQKRPLLIHPALGVGPWRLDRERMLEYPTLPRVAIARQLDRELQAEEMRLLYVAMTRAREQLTLVCAFDKLPKLLERLGGLWSAPADPEALAGLSCVGDWVLLAALGRAEALPLRQMAGMPLDRPLPQQDGYSWTILCAPVPEDAPPLPLPAEETAEPEDAPEREALRTRIFAPYPHAGSTALPSKLTATALKGRELDREAAEDAPPPSLHLAFDRPRFAAACRGLTAAQRGSAHHLAMQYLDFGHTDTRQAIEEQLRELTARQFLTEEQAEAVDAGRLLAFFRSPLGQKLRQQEGLQREFKFSVLLPASDLYGPEAGADEILLQGVVDCFWPEKDGLTVLDFKTDRIAPGGEAERAALYRGQLDAYAKALTEVFGRPVRRRLLWFFATDTLYELSET